MHRHAARAAGPLLLLAGLACGEAPPDFHVHGAAIFVKTDAPFARQPELAARLESVLAVGLAYWGGEWGHLDGRRITLVAGPYVSCGGSDRARGCFDGDLRIATADPGVGTDACVEQTVLVHEIGHAVMGTAGTRTRDGWTSTR